MSGFSPFSTWIGDSAKNRAWELLCAAKQSYDQEMATAALNESQRRAAERQLASCEASDWFWWPGVHNPSAAVAQFDELYRSKLASLYRALGLSPPESLAQPFATGVGHEVAAGGTISVAHLFLAGIFPGLLFGMADTAQPAGFDAPMRPDWLEVVGEVVAHRAPALLDVGIAGGWHGFYETTPDHNALIGEAAGVSRFLYATGFSGHGFLLGPAVGEVLPELKGKLDGFAMRVPTPNVSVVDLKFVAKRATSKDEINGAIKRAAEQQLKGILGYTDQPNVSGDFNHDPHSSVFHMDQTKVMDGTLVRIMSWYDNEWGFSNRMVDTAVAMGKLI